MKGPVGSQCQLYLLDLLGAKNVTKWSYFQAELHK